MASSCSNCKFLQDVNREVAPDRGWCPMWHNWQLIASKSCRFYEAKEFPVRKNSRPVRNFKRPEE